MTQTICVVVLFLLGLCDQTFAGAHKDYGEYAGCEQRLEAVNPEHDLGDNTIYYEAAIQESAKLIPNIEPVMMETSQKLDFIGTENDPRVEQVRLFFLRYKSPAAKYALLFVQVADEHKLDWKLLPAIAFIESSGGKYKQNNNIFGWDSGKKKFKSIEDGIRFVGEALQRGPYKNKTTAQKLRVYNVYPHYQVVARKVLRLIELTPLNLTNL